VKLIKLFRGLFRLIGGIIERDTDKIWQGVKSLVLPIFSLMFGIDNDDEDLADFCSEECDKTHES
jgi:hypothetical protein